MTDSRPNTSTRLLAVVQLIAFFGLLALDLWCLYDFNKFPAVLFRVSAYAGIAVVVGISVCWNFRQRAAGFIPAVRWRAWLETGGATVLMAAVLLAGAAATGNAEREFGLHVLGKAHPFTWLNVKIGLAAVQQVALQLFIFPACRNA